MLVRMQNTVLLSDLKEPSNLTHKDSKFSGCFVIQSLIV